MEDIITKLSGKDRKHKVTVKRKFIDEALELEANGASADGRAAQVFVVVINREKDYDPVISQKMSLKLLQRRPRGAATQNKKNDVRPAQNESQQDLSSSDEDNSNKKDDLNRSRRMLRGIRKSELAGSTVASSAGKYASDNELGSGALINKPHGDRLSSAHTSSTQPKFNKKGALIERSVDAAALKAQSKPASNGN